MARCFIVDCKENYGDDGMKYCSHLNNINKCLDSNKIIFLSKNKACAALRSLQVKNEYIGRVYPCPFCSGYHIGREKINTSRNKYKLQQARI